MVDFSGKLENKGIPYSKKGNNFATKDNNII